MDVNDCIEQFRDYIETNKDVLAKLNEADTKRKGYLIIDYIDLLKHNFMGRPVGTELCEYLIRDPEECLKAFSIGAQEVCIRKLQNLEIKVKNTPKSCGIPINEIRSQHIGSFLSAEGVIKRKSDVRAQIVSTKFECKCGAVINILQLDEKKFKEPSMCGTCKAKRGFVAVHKEEVDVFSLTLEEPTDMISGGTKLSQIKVLCRAGLTTPKIERMLYQGVRAEVIGQLKELQLRNPNGGLTNKIDWYIEANYVKPYDETFTEIKWTEDDINKFKELAQDEKWLDRLRSSVFKDVHGYHDECEGILLQMFSGVGKNREGLNMRGNFHILLVGDPGGAKSTILKIAQAFSPKAQYIAGAGISGAGITASVVKDELLGGWTVEAGALVLNSNGLLCLDEMDKMNDEFKKSLHEPLEQETVSISKANVQATMKAQTSLLAAANPKHGSYSEYDDVYSQIELSTTLINRFDLVYPIKESKLTSQDDRDIAMKILSRMGDEVEKPEFDRIFIRKYISYAKSIHPTMPKEVQIWIAQQYENLKNLKRRANESGKQTIPITARNVDGFRRIAEAVARSRLHEIVSINDAEIAYQKVIYSLQQVGIDPDSGEIMIESFANTKITKKDFATLVVKTVREFFHTNKNLVNRDTLYALMREKGFDNEMEVDEMIDKLKKSGDLYEPKRECFKTN